VKITEIDFSGFDTGEAVNFGDLFIPFADVGAGDVLTFDSDLIIAANTNILLSPAGSSSLGLQSITVHVDVPEPGSLVMLGFGSVLMIARRRRR